MAVLKTKIVFDVSPEFRSRWLRLCDREHLTQVEMFRRLVDEATTNSGVRPQEENAK